MEDLTDKIIIQSIANLNLPIRFENKLKHDLAFVINTCKDLYEIRIFGSCATGSYRASSDIDLLIITKDKVEDYSLRGLIQETLDKSIDGVSTDVVFYTVESYLGGQDLFSKELRKDSYLLWKRG